MAMGVDGSTMVVGDGGFMGLEWVIVGSWFCGWIDFGMGYGGFIVVKFRVSLSLSLSLLQVTFFLFMVEVLWTHFF